MEAEREGPRFQVFLLLWGSQALSLLGTGLTAFALGVWVYRATGSVTQFGLVVALSALPGLFLSPLFGALADRRDRRRLMIWSEAGAALRTLALLLVLAAGRLEVWHVYVAATVRSVCEALQYPAYFASVPLLVRRRHLGRANGMIGLAGSFAQVIAPAAAGLLWPRIGLAGILAIDLATFAAALALLAALRLPGPAPAGAPRSLFPDMATGWRYIRGHPALTALLALIVVLSFLNGSGMVLVTPLVLSLGSESDLGFVLSVGGVGMLAGGLLISAWGGPARKIRGILAFTALLGLGHLLAGARPSVALVACGLAAAFFSLPVINACNAHLWQVLVEPALQGRVLATQRMIQQLPAPLAYLLAGPLAERLFVPLLAPGGPLAGSLGQLLGVGPGRGIALQFVAAGTLLLAAAAVGALHPALAALGEAPPAGPTRSAEPSSDRSARPAAPAGRWRTEPSPAAGAASAPGSPDREA